MNFFVVHSFKRWPCVWSLVIVISHPVVSQWSADGQSDVVLICHLLESEVSGTSVMDVFFTSQLTTHVAGLTEELAPTQGA